MEIITRKFVASLAVINIVKIRQFVTTNADINIAEN